MLDQDVDARVARLQVRSRRPVNDLLAGEYLSVFKGRGVEFDEVREYQAGDDVRSIDWNVTARTGDPHIKRFIEERELSVYFVVDMSASGRFGSKDTTKEQAALELTSLLAFAATKNNDRVGLLLFTEEVERFVPLGKGRSHVMRILTELVSFEPRRRGTNIAGALEYMGHISRKHSVIFLISDFQAAGFEDQLKAVAREHDLIGLVIGDENERALPRVGLLQITDAETGETRIVDTDNAAVRESFLRSTAAHHRELLGLFEDSNVDYLDVLTGTDYVASLHEFFSARMRSPRGNHHA